MDCRQGSLSLLRVYLQVDILVFWLQKHCFRCGTFSVNTLCRPLVPFFVLLAHILFA
jgi:hypothetical protein